MYTKIVVRNQEVLMINKKILKKSKKDRNQCLEYLLQSR